MKNTILQQVNDIGSELGYPFYMYPDGTCGKSIVSGKMNAVGIVKKEFPVKELKSDFLSCSDENDKDVLAHLSQIGEKLGFPFYVYADGTCGTKSISQTDNLPFLMFVKKKFLVEKLVLDPELLQTIQAKEKEKSSYQDCQTQSNSMAPSYNKSNSSKVSASMGPHHKSLASEVSFSQVVMVCINTYEFSREEQKLMLKECTEDVTKAYIEKHQLCDEAQNLLIEKYGEDVIKTYIQKYQLDEEAQCLIIEKCSDNIVKAYIEKHKLCEKAQKLMIKRCSDDVIKSYRQKYSISVSMWLLLYKKYGFSNVMRD